jgi:hypothetical protein
MGLFNFFQDLAQKGRDSNQLHLIFQDNDRFAKLAMLNLGRCLQDRNIQTSELVLRKAQQAVSANPKITMGEFIDTYLR